MKIVSNILITIILSTIGSIGAYKYAPMSWFETKQAPKFGTTITTINGSDTLSNSRTTINDNFTALNNGKIEVGTTSVNSITALNNLATIGTITSGTWSGTAIAVSKGGTGTTSPTSNQVIIGDSTNGFKVIGFGNSGQFLTSGGNGVAPSWTTGGIDQTLDYNFTGSAFRVKNLIASTTVSFSNSGSGVSYIFPASLGATSTVLSTNASGQLSWMSPKGLGAGSFLGASTTDKSVNNSTTETTYGTGTLATLPANTMGTSGAIRVRAYISTYSDTGGNSSVTVNLKLGGTTVCNIALPASANAYGAGYVNFTVFSNASASAQSCLGDYFLAGSVSVPAIFESSSSIDTSSDQVVSITFQWSNDDPGDTESFTMSGAEVIFEGK